MRISESSRHRGELNELAVELAAHSAGFRRRLAKGVLAALADLVRAMNCYYSNPIEGHDTHPVDIERALKNDFLISLSNFLNEQSPMVTGSQLRAARALLNLDRSSLAELAGLSLPTIQRMESAEGIVGGNVESLMRVIEALKSAGIELIGEDQVSQGGGRGVRLISPQSSDQ